MYSFSTASVTNCHKQCLLVVAVQSLSRALLFATPRTAALQASPSFTISWSWLKPIPLSQQCHPTVSSSVVLFSSCRHYFPATGYFPNESALCIRRPKDWSFCNSPSNEYSDWFPLGWTGLIFLQNKGLLSRVFSNTTVQKNQFFSAQTSLWSNSHIHTWLLEKT